MTATETHAATAVAHPNIALVKYWGKRDEALNLPCVGSLSITLDRIRTHTRVAFVEEPGADRVQLNGQMVDAPRVGAQLDLLRARAGVAWRAEVMSDNNFPTAAGLASSASGFAALTVAGARALGLALSAVELSELARRGSGSAARSIFGGFAQWNRGERADGADSVAHALLDRAAWPLAVAIAVTSTAAKAIGSTAGMRHTAATSPFQHTWESTQESDLGVARAAVLAQDFDALAAISEHSCLKMHALAMASRPGLLYWNGATVEAMHRVRALRATGVPVFFTVDAGPQLKAVCLPAALPVVARALRDVPGVLDVIECSLGEGAHIIVDGMPST